MNSQPREVNDAKGIPLATGDKVQILRSGDWDKETATVERINEDGTVAVRDWLGRCTVAACHVRKVA